jgi:hypothetical protein
MFNIEQLDVLSSCDSPPHHWQIAFLGRIRYCREGKEGVAPPHSSALVFLSKDRSLQNKFMRVIEEGGERGSRKKRFMLCEGIARAFISESDAGLRQYLDTGYERAKKSPSGIYAPFGDPIFDDEDDE